MDEKRKCVWCGMNCEWHLLMPLYRHEISPTMMCIIHGILIHMSSGPKSPNVLILSICPNHKDLGPNKSSHYFSLSLQIIFGAYAGTYACDPLGSHS